LQLWTGLIITLACSACGGGTGPEPDDVFDWPGAYAGSLRVEAWQPLCGTDGCPGRPARTDCFVSLELVPVSDSGLTGTLELSRCVEVYRDADWTPPRVPFLRMGSFGAIEGKFFLYEDPTLPPWVSAVYSGGGAPAALAEVVGCSPRGTWERWFVGLQAYRDGPDSPKVETILGKLQYLVEGTRFEVGDVPLTCAGVDVRLSLVLLVEKVSRN
jgi:hypothetical protein